MQSEPQATEQSQSPQHQQQKKHSQPSHIQIDTKMVQKKQQILLQYYQSTSESQKLQILNKWPSPEIKSSIQHIDYITKTNNASYFGQLCNEMMHGYGLLIYEHNNSQGQGQGQGQIVVDRVGRFYEGQFQNSCKHGYGFQYINGDIYVGKFINNKPEDSNGIFLWKNGDLYMGNFVNGMKHGQGRWQSGSDYYDGTWKLNRPEGTGKIHTNASQYEGDVKNGYKHGRGIQIFANGDRYEGLYANGKPEGDGVYSWKNGAIYKGQFKNGIRYGYGSWSYGSETYEGDYINDKRNGQGVYKWGGGSYYRGQFMDDLRHGFGEMHWNQNSYYKGQWREGLQWGQGQIWQDHKLVSKGQFEQGKLIQQPNRLQKSNTSEHSQAKSQGRVNRSMNEPKQLKKSQQKPSTRYPAITRSTRAHSHSKNNHLSQIDQFPKLSQPRHKKYIATTSFSNHTKNSAYSSIANQSFDHHKHQHRQTVKFHDIEDTKQQQFGRKTNYNLEPGFKLPVSKEKKVHINSKRTLYEKKKIQAVAKTAAKSASVVEMSQTQLGPIRWKNFTHMKSNTGDVGNNRVDY